MFLARIFAAPIAILRTVLAVIGYISCRFIETTFGIRNRLRTASRCQNPALSEEEHNADKADNHDNKHNWYCYEYDLHTKKWLFVEKHSGQKEFEEKDKVESKHNSQ